MKQDTSTLIMATAAIGGALWLFAAHQARARSASGQPATSTNPPAAGRAFFASPAVATGVQAGQGLAKSLGTLLNRALGGVSSAPTAGAPVVGATGDFARLDRTTEIPQDGSAFNPPGNLDPYSSDYTMPADLAAFEG